MTVSPRELVTEAALALFHKPARTLLTCLGTLLGIAGVVAVTGLQATGRRQVTDSFLSLEATTVTLAPAGDGAGPINEEARGKVERLDGVEAAAVYAIRESDVEVESAPAGGVLTDAGVEVMAGRSFAALGPRMAWGRDLTNVPPSRPTPWCVVGREVATPLGLTSADSGRVITVDGVPCVLAGVFRSVERRPELVGSVVMSDRGAVTGPWSTEMLVVVRPGAAGAVAGALPLVVAPAAPESVVPQASPEIGAVRQSVLADFGGVMWVAVAVALGVGMLGILTATLLSINQRRSEFGLRRALGARRTHIAGQVLLETAVVGLLGSVSGVVVGELVVLIASGARGWVPVMTPWALVAGPVAGLVIGVCAGLPPAIRAATIEPSTALRDSAG